MYEFIKKSLEKYKLLDNEVWFITLSAGSDSVIHYRDIQRDFISLWMKIKYECKKAECFFIVVESDGKVKPHIHMLLANFNYPKEMLNSWWEHTRRCFCIIKKEPVEFHRLEILSVYFSTQEGAVYEVNCSDGWYQDE